MGINLSYCVQPLEDGPAKAFILGEQFVRNKPSALFADSRLYYGHNFASILEGADAHISVASVFAYQVIDPKCNGVLEFDAARKFLHDAEVFA